MSQYNIHFTLSQSFQVICMILQLQGGNNYGDLITYTGNLTNVHNLVKKDGSMYNT